MKRNCLSLIALLVILSSCSIKKPVRQDRAIINGSWILSNISYENNTGNFKSVLFNDAQAECFEGSEWFFRNNNSTGQYTITSSDSCNGGDRFIRWSVINNSESYTSQLQFKFIDEKFKDISGKVGYRLNIATLLNDKMILKSNASVDGNLVTLVYEFTKNNNNE